MRSRIDPTGFVRLPAKPSKARRVIPAGSAIRIVGGPLEGAPAIYVGQSQGERELVFDRDVGRPAPDRGRFPSHLAAMMAEQQLLTAMQAHPGASLSVLGSVVGAGRGAIASKLHKLARARDSGEKPRWTLAAGGSGGGWRGAPYAGVAELEAAQEPAPEDTLRWVKPVNCYLRVWTSPFACARYG